MTAISREYRFRVYQQGSASVVEYTYQQEIAEPPTVPGQTARPEDGAVETVPWAITLIDRNKVVSRTLGDSSSGRLIYHGRVCDLSHRDRSGTWSVIATGRVSDIQEPQRGSYVIQVDDERMIEREADVFQETDTITLVPTGLRYDYGGIARTGSCKATVVSIRTVGASDYVLLQVHCRINNEAVLSHIINDVKAQPFPGYSGGANADTGNFVTTRIHCDGAEREIIGFDVLWGPGIVQPLAFEPYPAKTQVEGIKRRRNEEGVSSPDFYVWVPVGNSNSGDNTWPTTPPSGGDVLTDVQLYTVGLRPSEEFPYHIGVADSGHTYGTAAGKIHPFELLELLYDEAGVRYDATAIQALQDDPRYVLSEYRIVRPPANLADWVEANIYKPWQVLPFIGADGEIEPRSVALPGGDTYDPATLFEFTEHNMVGGAPTWHSPGRDAKNVVIGSYSTEDRPAGGLVAWGLAQLGGAIEGAADYIKATTTEILVEHDNLANVQRREHQVKFPGIHTRDEADPLIERYARDMFSLFGDGPQRGTIEGLRDTVSVTPGQWVKVTTSDAPNPATTGGRGGTRLALVLSRGWTPAGPDFTVLDAGADVQILSTPTISGVINNTNIPEHSQTITYSGLPGAGTTDWGYLEFAVNATEPPASSPLWKLSKIIVGSAAGSVTGYSLPSGSVVWWRLRAATPFRVRSAWSTAASQTTASLSAPTGISFASTSGKATVASWTNGERDYPIEVLVDSIPCEVLAEGSVTTWIRNLEQSTDYTIQVRHIDQYGGASALLGTTDNLTTTASANAWPTPEVVIVLQPGRLGVPR